MGSLAGRRALIRCIEQLEDNVMVDQHYRSSERGKAGMFWLQQVFLDFAFLSMTSWLTSDHVTNKKHIERFIGNMLSFVRIILSSRLSQFFCLKNFLGGFLTNWFDDNVSLLTMWRV